MKKLVLMGLLCMSSYGLAQNGEDAPSDVDYEASLRANLPATFYFNPQEQVIHVSLENKSKKDLKNPGIICYMSVGNGKDTEYYDTVGFYVFKETIPNGAHIEKKIHYLVRTIPEPRPFGYEHIDVRYVQKATCYLANVYDMTDAES